jgi:hypothetical protein
MTEKVYFTCSHNINIKKSSTVLAHIVILQTVRLTQIVKFSLS